MILHMRYIKLSLSLELSEVGRYPLTTLSSVDCILKIMQLQCTLKASAIISYTIREVKFIIDAQRFELVRTKNSGGRLSNPTKQGNYTMQRSTSKQINDHEISRVENVPSDQIAWVSDAKQSFARPVVHDPHSQDRLSDRLSMEAKKTCRGA
jgi:hypothetical protein